MKIFTLGNIIYFKIEKDTYQIVGKEHGHWSGHQTVENGNEDNGAWNPNRDIGNRIFNLLRQRRHGVVSYVADVNQSSSIEHPWSSEGKEPARMVRIRCLREVLRVSFPKPHHDHKYYEQNVNRCQNHVQYRAFSRAVIAIQTNLKSEQFENQNRFHIVDIWFENYEGEPVTDYDSEN